MHRLDPPALVFRLVQSCWRVQQLRSCAVDDWFGLRCTATPVESAIGIITSSASQIVSSSGELERDTRAMVSIYFIIVEA